ncbi:MAG TPA: glycerol-3-phosphate acyltransferase [Terriglobia bacterium]|nr:glycerol-3-phosphate acyltransferase [Terriglobia bacterium]
MENILLRLLVCFALGAIPFAVISMMGSGVDIRKVGSGNPGFNNVLRVSKGRAIVALIGDMGKGYLAVWMVLKEWPLADPWPSAVGWAWLCGFAAVLGHCFSPLLRFNGGKGIATSGGVMLVLYPLWAVLALAYFGAARVTMGKLKWREAGALASLSTWLLFTLLMFIFVGRVDATYSAVLTLFLAWRHQNNLRHLAAA